VIRKAERLLEGANRRFVVTSLDALAASPQSVYDDGYTPRGDMENRIIGEPHQWRTASMENRIKAQLLMRFADRTSCHAFASNQFRLLLSSFGYVLLHHLRTEHLADTELAPAQVHRLRLTRIKIAGRVRVTARRVVFHLSSSCPYHELSVPRAVRTDRCSAQPPGPSIPCGWTPADRTSVRSTPHPVRHSSPTPAPGERGAYADLMSAQPNGSSRMSG
jgi:hypothetical protein